MGENCESHSVMSDSLWSNGLYDSWNSPHQNTAVGSLPLLQVIFPTQVLKPGLPHCGWILYQLRRKRSPRVLKWVAYPFSSRSSQPRNQTRVSCITGGFFTNYSTNSSKCMHVCPLSRVWLVATLRTVAHQAPLSMEFPRQEFWSGFAISSSRGSS